jgi:hypothetical protein
MGFEAKLTFASEFIEFRVPFDEMDVCRSQGFDFRVILV